MAILKKKTESGRILESRALLDANQKDLKICVSLADGKDALCARLTDLWDKVRYAFPSADERAAAIDKKMSNRIVDLKSVMKKVRDGSDESKAMEIIEDIELMLFERGGRS